MIKYRVTKNSGTKPGKRIATQKTFDTKKEAHDFVISTNNYFPGANARIVKDSERIRRMIP
jgi:hypothetical protein